MKLWKLFVLLLALVMLGTSLLACGGEAETTPEVTTPEATEPEVTDPEVTAPETTAPETTVPEITVPETTAPETTAPETTAPETEAPVCTHPNMTEKVLKISTCYAGGKVEKTCGDCGYKAEVATPPSHDDDKVYTASSGITEYVCKRCGERAMIVEAGKRMKLSAYCEGELTFAVTASADASVEVLLDGQSQGDVSLDDDGKGRVRFTNLEKGGYSIVFVNKGTSDVRIKNEKIEGYFNRPGAVYVEVLGKGKEAYSSFNVYIQTSDLSEEYYVCYHFTYRLDKTANNFAPNTCTNTEFYRVNGATLYRVIEVDDTTIKTEMVSGIGGVLGGGEISFAVMQQYPYKDMLADGAKVEMGDMTRAPDFIGGYHGDEWMTEVVLTADCEVIDLQSSEREVIPCSTVTFDLTGTMYAWGTSKADDRGVPVAEHTQNFVLDSTGVTDVQTIQWLRDDFVIHAAYLPMFTMMRGADGNRFIETMRAYDAEGNLLEEYTMAPEPVASQIGVLSRSDCCMYEYSGNKGITSMVSFKALNDGPKFTGSRIDLRTASKDNKLYVGVQSAAGGKSVPAGDVWEVELKFHIDYVVPEA